MTPRSTYLRTILMPALWELVTLEQTGLRVDLARRRTHKERLHAEEQSLAQLVRLSPSVEALVSARRDSADRALAAAIEGRDLERSARMDAAKSAGVKASRRSTFTPLVAKARAQFKAASADFNLGSAAQKAWLLYEGLGLPPQRHPKTKAVTTDARALARLASLKGTSPEARSIIEAMQQYEHVNQLRTTFIEARLEGGRLHSRYGLHRTGTGRIASGADRTEKGGDSDTNAQNWPKELRDIIIPEEGWLMVQGDWSRVEWLLTLWLAQDKAGLAAALAGEDQHRRLAAALFGVDYAAVTPEQRTRAKKVTHGANYGMGARKLALEMQCSEIEAKRALAAFRAAFPLVQAWRERVTALSEQQHFLETPFGWRRYFWTSDPPKALAFLPSATGADMMKLRLPPIATMLRSFGGRLLTVTHDSYLGEVPAGHGEEAAKRLTELMQAPFRTLVEQAFPADVRLGPDWKSVS